MVTNRSVAVNQLARPRAVAPNGQEREDADQTFIVADFEFGLQRFLDGVEAYLGRSMRG